MARPRRRSETVRITLDSDLRIGMARDVYARLEAAQAPGNVEIDGGAVERIDAAGLQALAAGLVRLRAKRVECRWAQVSAALAQSADIAGLRAALELPA